MSAKDSIDSSGRKLLLTLLNQRKTNSSFASFSKFDITCIFMADVHCAKIFANS